MLRSVLEIHPTTNHALASPAERDDAMQSFARVLMGLSHPLQIVGSARPVAGTWDWSKPPQIERHWYAVIADKSPDTLAWQTRTLKSSLEGVGFRCYETDYSNSNDNRLRRTQLDSGGRSVHRVWWRLRTVGHAGDVGLYSGDSGLCGDVRVYRDAIFDGHDWCASLVLRRWPREVAPGWLGQALSGDQPVDVAIHIQPQDAQRIARFLKKQQAWQSDEHTARPDAGNALGRQDAESTRLKLIAHTDKPVKVAVVFMVRAPTQALLAQRVSTLTHEIGLSLADVRPVTFEHDRGLEATQLTGECNLLGAWRTLDCTSVASCGIFQPATIVHDQGADIGTTHEGGMLVRLDPFDWTLRSFGGLLTGSVGSGKSYFLKLLLRRLEGVELRIVEHSDPPEYDGVPNLMTFNVADLSEAEQAEALRQYITDLWTLARADPKPRLLVLDELWAVLKRPELAKLVEEIARRGRKYGLALWIATQQVEELLESGKAVFDNAAIKIFLQQEDRDLEGLCKAAHLSAPARRLLRSAARGQALIDCGKMLVLVDVQASPGEHALITTDPRETWAQDRRMMAVQEVQANALVDADTDGDDGSGGAVLRGDHRGGRAGRNRRAVALAEQ